MALRLQYDAVQSHRDVTMVEQDFSEKLFLRSCTMHIKHHKYTLQAVFDLGVKSLKKYA